MADEYFRCGDCTENDRKTKNDDSKYEKPSNTRFLCVEIFLIRRCKFGAMLHDYKTFQFCFLVIAFRRDYFYVDLPKKLEFCYIFY